jgi:hypothetical protein
LHNLMAAKTIASLARVKVASSLGSAAPIAIARFLLNGGVHDSRL